MPRHELGNGIVIVCSDSQKPIFVRGTRKKVRKTKRATLFADGSVEWKCDEVSEEDTYVLSNEVSIARGEEARSSGNSRNRWLPRLKLIRDGVITSIIGIIVDACAAGIPVDHVAVAVIILVTSLH
jgi:hypothetical protein